MLRRAWKPLVATGAVGGSAYWWYNRSSKAETFDLIVPGKRTNGKREMESKSLNLFDLETTERLIRQHASLNTEERPNGLTWKHATAFMASNDPIEDAFAHKIVRRNDKDFLFWTVMDGHGGFDTSRLLSRTLIEAVSLQLAALETPKPSGFLSSWTSKPAPSTPPTPQQISQAIQAAFIDLDSELTKAPIRLLVDEMTKMSKSEKEERMVPDLSGHPSALKLMLPALSGSCALLAMFDTANRDLYVAVTGDSRAVAGIWEPSADSGKGIWRVDVLSDDQTAEIPSEVKRLQEEHPGEAEVVRNGRILGGLQPSRAFGDARYKWASDMQAVLYEAFLAGTGRSMRVPPPTLHTPPYVTATPEVTHRKLSFEADTPGSKRFLVMATDGLWDVLSNEEVVALVGGHFAGLKGKISKSDLTTAVPTAIASAGAEGKQSLHARQDSSTGGSWAFADENVGTHLIRNALGGGDEYALRRMVSIPSPHSRRFRDDITVTVVWWETGKESEAQVTSIKSKL